MRLAYTPERPLHLLLVRAYRFPTPLSIPYRKTYAGCRSRVALHTNVDGPLLDGAVSALDDARYERHRRGVLFAAFAGRELAMGRGDPTALLAARHGERYQRLCRAATPTRHVRRAWFAPGHA